MNDEYTIYPAGIFTLLAAAGCTPQSSGGGDRDWSVCFLDRDGAPVKLSGTRYSYNNYNERQAVIAWLTERGLKPTPEEVRRCADSDRVGAAAAATERNTEAIHALTLSVAALRSSQATDGAIRVWRFWSAPPEYRALSNHGGDEDWVAHLPAGEEEPAWADTGSSFGCCSVSRHELPDGSCVLIGAHA